MRYQTHTGLIKKYFLFSRRGSLMNRRVPLRIEDMYFNSAKLSVKLCETLRDMLLLYFLITPTRMRVIRLLRSIEIREINY